MNTRFEPSVVPPAAREGALGPYLRAVRAHRLLVIVVTLVAVAASVAWLQVRTPQYEASAQILVTPLPQDDENFLGLQLLRDSGDPTRTVQTAATIIESPRAAQAVARQLGPDWSVKRVLDAIDVEPEGESNILSITATAEEAGLAARVANRFAKSAIGERNRELRPQVQSEIKQLRARLEGLRDPTGAAQAELAGRIDRLSTLLAKGDPTLSLSQQASAPSSAAGAGPFLIIPLALLAGLALGSGAALLLEVVDRRVRNEDEFAGIYPLPVLVRVPKLPKRELQKHEGISWFMPPIVREAFRTVLVQLNSGEQQRRTLMVTSPSSGDGKTTSAVNLAVSIAAAGHSVILMDLDIRKPDVANSLGIEAPDSTLGALLRHDAPERLPELLVQAPQLPSMQVLTTGSAFGDVAVLDALGDSLPDVLEAAANAAEFVVIDTPPLGEVSDALRIAHVADAILLVVRPGNTIRRSLEVTRDLLERTQRRPTGYLVVGAAERAVSPYYHYGLHAARGEMMRRLPFAGTRAEKRG